MEYPHRLNQFSDKLGIVKPKKEVHTQSMNHYIFLHFRQIFVNGGPLRLELVVVAEGPVRGRIFKNCMRVTRYSEIAAVRKFNTSLDGLDRVTWHLALVFSLATRI